MSKTKTRLKIKSRLLEFRAEARLTQEELAERVGVTRATINAIEKGDYNPSLELAFRLAIFFKTEVEVLFSFVILKRSFFSDLSAFDRR